MKNTLLVLLALVAVLIAGDNATAQFPMTTGRNVRMLVTNVAQRVSAGGTNCQIGISLAYVTDGVDTPQPAWPVCSGYNPTATPLTVHNCFAYLCTNSAKCGATFIFRNTVPDAIWVITPAGYAGAGVPVLIEMGAGCTSM